MNVELHGAKLPEGWTASVDSRGIMEVGRVAPGAKFAGGYVSIDFKARIFSGGSGWPWRHAGTETYAGRGWKKKIIEDACAWLEKEMSE